MLGGGGVNREQIRTENTAMLNDYTKESKINTNQWK